MLNKKPQFELKIDDVADVVSSLGGLSFEGAAKTLFVAARKIGGQAASYDAALDCLVVRADTREEANRIWDAIWADVRTYINEKKKQRKQQGRRQAA